MTQRSGESPLIEAAKALGMVLMAAAFILAAGDIVIVVINAFA